MRTRTTPSIVRRRLYRKVRIRLIKRLADAVDGVDLTRASEGDVLDLSERDAELLVAEGWGELVPATALRGRARAARRKLEGEAIQRFQEQAREL